MRKKTVILVGFGRPPSMADISPFLYEIFSDPVASPFSRLGIFRKPVARLIAVMAEGRARKRYLNVANKPDSLSVIGSLAERLKQRLADARTKVVAAMRYGEPSIRNVLSDLHRKGFEEADVVPLFPHKAVSTWGTINEAVKNAPIRTKVHGSWYDERGFVSAWVDSINNAWSRDMHLVFSAHAIPVYHQRRFGDKYAEEIEESARLITDALGDDVSASIAYQSRAPFGKWTGPSLRDELTRMGRAGIKRVLIAPISFVYDNVETWCDLDLDIIPNSATFGLEKIARAIPPVGSAGIVDAIANMVTI